MLKAIPVWYPDLRTKAPRDRVLVSGTAGALTGATAGLILSMSDIFLAA